MSARKGRKPSPSLQRFKPAIEEFYTVVLGSGNLSNKRLSEFFKRWEHRESPRYAKQLKLVLQAYLDAGITL